MPNRAQALRRLGRPIASRAALRRIRRRPGKRKAPQPYGRGALFVHLREINENKLETLLALRADVLARAGERLTDEDTSQVSAQAIHNPIRAKMETNAVARTIMQHQHHLTAAERDEVARLYQDGLPVRTICERFNISKGVVYRIRLRRGLPRRRTGMTDEQKKQAVELRARGVSAATIGRQFGINIKTVLAYLQAVDSDQARQ